jgi:hypothetical protein
MANRPPTALQPAVGLTTFELASTLPEALRARAWKNVAAGTATAVSKPLLGFLETGFKREALDPLRICQKATVVAPFQLT